MKIRQFTFSYSREKWAIFFNLRFAAQNTFKCGYEDINGYGGKFLGNVCAPTEVATRLPFVLFRNYWQKKNVSARWPFLACGNFEEHDTCC